MQMCCDQYNTKNTKEADEANAEDPGYARPFGIYADDKLVGFCMFSFDPEDEEVFESRLYRIEKKTFGRIGGFTKLVFGNDGVEVNGVMCKKL